ncbi:cell wall-binding repeat-containing protein [Candidatus Poriferisodalis sp.]|uniref:cell wall-binding repeat-containing protein n=1 Tax=Candidatus Poriferisodalis sp. TaxID=3101277 RepID=UPI003B595E0A
MVEWACADEPVPLEALMVDSNVAGAAAQRHRRVGAGAEVTLPARRGRRRWVLVLLCGLLLAGTAVQFPAGAASTDASFTRVAGATRYETGVAIAREYVRERADAGARADTAIVTSGADAHFGFALIAPPLSRHHGAPLLLTPPYALPAAVETFLSSNGFTQVIIVGGTDVVSDDVAAELRALDLAVSRVGSDDLYRTSIAVASRVGSPAGIPGRYRSLGPTALLATGEVFADALTAGPLAYRGRHPVLLTPSLDLHPDVKRFLIDSGTSHVVIFGGPRAVSPWVEYDIGDLGITVSRLYGPDRYATATRVAEELLGPDSPQRCFDGAEFGLAFGRRAADALVASPLLGERCLPLLLTERNVLPPTVADLLDSDEFAPGDKDGNLALTVLGGPNAVTSFAALQAVAAGTLPKISADIAGVEGRCFLDVTFDEPVRTSDAENPANYRRGRVRFGSSDATVDAGSGDTTSAATILIAGARKFADSVVPVACDRPLAAKEEIEIRGDVIGEHDGRRVVRRVVTSVAADRVPPTISMTATDAATAALVTASEPLRLRTGIAEFRRPGADPEIETVIFQVNDGATSFEVPAPARWGGSLREGDRVTILAGAVEDLAGNAANRAVATAMGDNTPPEVARVTVSRPRGRTVASISVDAQRNGDVVNDALRVTARPFGGASGAIGNNWTLEIVLEADWGATRIAVPNVWRTGEGGRVRVQTAPGRAVEDIAADLNRNLSFRSWFIADLADEVAADEELPVTFSADIGPARLSGGESSVDITVVWSEPVLDCEAGDGLVVSGRLQIDADNDGSADYALDGNGAAEAGVMFVTAPGRNPAIIAGGATCDLAAGVQDGTLVARIQSDDLTMLPGLASKLLAGDGAAIDLNGNWSEQHSFSRFTRP